MSEYPYYTIRDEDVGQKGVCVGAYERLQAEVERLEGLNKMWVGIKADRDERIEERDEARAIARRLYEWMKGMFRVPFPEADAEFIANAPWLEDER